MLWGCLAAEGTGNIVQVEGRMDYSIYPEILEANVQRSICYDRSQEPNADQGLGRIVDVYSVRRSRKPVSQRYVHNPIKRQENSQTSLTVINSYKNGEVQTRARQKSKSRQRVSYTESLINWLTKYWLQNIDQLSHGGTRV